METLTLDFFINQWDKRKKEEELILIVDKILSDGIVKEITTMPIPKEKLDSMVKIMRERPFSNVINLLFNKYSNYMLLSSSIIIKIKNLQHLVELFFKLDNSNKTKLIVEDYLKLFIELNKFNEQFSLYTTKRLSGEKVKEFGDEYIDLLSRFIKVPKEDFKGIFENTMPI